MKPRHICRIALLGLAAGFPAISQAAITINEGDFDGPTAIIASSGNQLVFADVAGVAPGGSWYRSSNGHTLNKASSGATIAAGPSAGVTAYITPPDSSTYAGVTTGADSRSRTVAYVINDAKATTGVWQLIFDVLHRGPDPDLQGTNPATGVDGSVAAVEIFGINGDWDSDFDVFNNSEYNGNFDTGFEYNGANAVSLGGANFDIVDTGIDTVENQQANWQLEQSVTFDLGGTGHDWIVIGFSWGRTDQCLPEQTHPLLWLPPSISGSTMSRPARSPDHQPSR